MKCLLVSPPWTFGDTHSEMLQEGVAGVTPPSGLLYVAAVLRDAGHGVSVIDGAFTSHKNMLAEIKKINPDFLGVSIVSMLWAHGKQLIDAAKKQNPKMFIAAGGPHPTTLSKEVMKECKGVDAIICGEGELTTKDLADALEKKKNLDSVKGIIYRAGKKVVSTKPRPLLKDLDTLPYPAFDLVDIKKYRPSVGHYKKLPYIGVVMSRGCPMNCLYCYKLTGNIIRERNPIKVVDEIEHYVKAYGIKEVKFWTEWFTYKKETVMAFCDELTKRKLNIVWSCTARVDNLDEEMLRKMKEAGCWYLQFGIESGVQKNLNTLRKGTTIKQIEDAVALTHKVGLKSFCSYILGIPGETFEEAKQTIEFACKLNSFYAEFFPLTPFPGTDLYTDVHKYGRMVGSMSELTMHHIPFVPHSMTKEQLAYLQKYAFRRYYSRPSFILMRLASIRSFEDLKIGWWGFKALLSVLRG